MSERRVRGMLLLAGLCVAGNVAVAAAAPKVAIFYGDSLTYESRSAIRAHFATRPGWHAVVRSYPSVALCDMTAWLRRDLASYRPTVIALETHGGVSTPCMKQGGGGQIAPGSAEYYVRYSSDLDSFFAAATASGARVVFFETPPDANALSQATQDGLTAVAIAEAAKYDGVSISSTGKAALGGHKWSATEPCLISETAAMGCRNGQIVVRSPDSVHFCPDGYADFRVFVAGCTHYSSGAFRYGRAMASAATSPTAPINP